MAAMTERIADDLNQNLDDGRENGGEPASQVRNARQRPKELSMQAVTNLNVLVVDDQQVMRDFHAARLRGLGINQVALAASATEALKQLHEEKFDLVISDWIMPDMTGLDLVKAVRGHPVLKKMPIIMASTWPGRDQMEMAKAEGVNHYLVKPFQTVQLRDSLQDLFGTLQERRRRGLSSGRAQRLIKIRDDVVDGLQADRQPHDVRTGACRHALVLGQVAGGGRRGMQDQAARIPEVGEVGEQLARLHDLGAGLVAALDAEREDAAAAASQIPAGERVVAA